LLNYSLDTEMITKVLKETTRLTGLAVSQNPHHSLTVLYDKILRTLEKIPDTAVYKQHTKPLIEERLQLVNSIKDAGELEKKINSGQIEEVIKEAEYELSLSRKMVNWKPWESLVSEAPKNQWKWPVSS
jgi:NADH dehydrogenase (ubiquinone) 1 alpha subcomplex subunit 5